MVTLLGSVVRALLFVSTTATAVPSAEPPPALPVPDLTQAALVTVLEAQGGDGLVIQRQDNSYLTIRLAGVLVDPEDGDRRHTAWAFLHNLLAGERVWMVRSEPVKQGIVDQCYVYRWPDRTFVNLEMVRQGYADMAVDKMSPQAEKVFSYWRDQARLHRKGVWGMGGKAAATAPTLLTPAAAAPASPVLMPAVVAPASKPAVQPTVQPAVEKKVDRTIVYVGASGKKYHTAECRTLRSTKTPKTLDEARKTHEPCKQCKPPK